MIDAETVSTMIRTKVAQHKSIKQAADALGIDPNHLSKILRGALPPGLKLVGVRRVIGYEIV